MPLPDLLQYTRNIINSKWFRNKFRTDSTRFNRATKFSFPRLITFLARLAFGSVRREAEAFLEQLHPDSPCSVGKGTITKARANLKPAAFRELLHQTATFTYDTSMELERPGGLRILAIDGSRLSLPEVSTIRARFSPNAKGPGQEGPPQARASICMDVLNGIVVDALLKPLSWGERRMACKHLRFMGDGDLVLLDRGYAGVGFFKRILATGADLCARVKVGHSKAISEFVASGRPKAVIHLTDEEGSISLMAVRIELASDLTEVLLTSLTDWSCEPEFFGQIYNLRWGVESEYHFLKAPLQLENFSGKTVRAVEQDFYARIFAASFAAMLALPVHAEIDRITARCSHAYQLQWTEAFALLRRHLVKLVLGTTDVATRWLRMLLDHMTRYRDIVRPARHFPRKQSLRPVRYPTNQKTL